MRKSTNKEFLEGKAFMYAVDKYCNITDCFISSYKNYSYCITNFYNNLFNVSNIFLKCSSIVSLAYALN